MRYFIPKEYSHRVYNLSKRGLKMKLKSRAVVSTLGLLALFILVAVNSSSLFFMHEGIDKLSRANLTLNLYKSGSSDSDSDSRHALFSDGGSDSLSTKERKKNISDLLVQKDEIVERLLEFLSNINDSGFDFDGYMSYTYSDLVQELSAGRLTKARTLRLSPTGRRDKLTNFDLFHGGIRQFALYNPNSPYVEGLLEDMHTQPIVSMDTMEKGTQLKMGVVFSNGARAVFKPMRWPRDRETDPNHFYFNDYERHNAEIAAFYLDRLLGFYSVPPVAGRFVNMTSEIMWLSTKKLQKTFYTSPVNNLCFFGECTYYCDSRHSFCGNGDIIEGSFMAFLPPDKFALRQRWKSPWRRSYSKLRKAEWEVDDNYCQEVRKTTPYNNGKMLLDIIDMHIFDFLTGNMDRHHLEIFKDFGNYSFLIHLDNGRGFGKISHDERSILAPLQQCCLIRESTFLKLLKFYTGPEKLGQLLRNSLERDVLRPLLADGHYTALDRRVTVILKTVYLCLEKTDKYNNVIIKDKF
ncbi:hypothetical protein CHS0354_032196 [Potamilus streckersoni]|uniref:FAM20 C-terminal domain-containing protein n=1 Tax=Potamilus streckersoni TaxID=2493646 RepID=A0AAE0TGR8_9BIVA|nr:hypothetical protein CHS0354_032196 [Potamilus streckersoni]